MLSRVVSQLSKLSTLLFWLQSFEILIGARLSGQYNLEKQTQQTEANDSFGPEGQEVLDMFLFLGKCLHSCCLISQLIITIIRFIFVFLWELLRSKHSMVGFVSPNDRGKRLSRPIKGRLAGKWSCAHPHTTKPYYLIHTYCLHLYIAIYCLQNSSGTILLVDSPLSSCILELHRRGVIWAKPSSSVANPSWSPEIAEMRDFTQNHWQL